MEDIGSLLSLIGDAVQELDRCLGMRKCGMTISGAFKPGYRGIRGSEDPVSITSRVLFLPMVGLLGYGKPVYDGDLEKVPGTAMALVPANRPLDGALKHLMEHLRTSEDLTGIVTDGIEWILILRGPHGPKVDSVHDLRPYYVEELDRRRFKNPCRTDRGPAERFLERLDAGNRPH